MSAAAPAAFGVYVHIPFCASRCDYCAFATWTDRHHLQESYVAAVRTEVDRAVAAGMAPATSVFFGGGTPSLLPAAELISILDRIPLASGAEVTVECNPDTVTAALAVDYRSGGVTRISMGVQSMVPSVLAALGRTHHPENVAAAVAHVREAGFETFNLDLIYGVAGESFADWSATLEAVLALDPPHVSAYALTVEAGTPLALDKARYPDDDDQADKYLVAEARLGAAGLANYEISNWARPGHECRHNWLYWEQGPYLGFGCAAHSHGAGRRWWNVRTPERYIAMVEGGEDPGGGEERLGDDEYSLERRQLALRTRAGISADALAEDDRREFLEAGLLRDDGPVLVLTPEGRLLANEVAVRLLA